MNNLNKMPKPALLKEVEMCENCDECYGFMHTIIADDIFVQCELSKINTSITSDYGLVYKYNKAIEVLRTVGKMLAELIISCIKPVIPDITYELGGETIYFYSEQRKNEYMEDRTGMDYVLDDVVYKFLKKTYSDIKFSFDCFFTVYLTRDETKQIRKNLKKEFKKCLT